MIEMTDATTADHLLAVNEIVVIAIDIEILESILP